MTSTDENAALPNETFSVALRNALIGAEVIRVEVKSTYDLSQYAVITHDDNRVLFELKKLLLEDDKAVVAFLQMFHVVVQAGISERKLFGFEFESLTSKEKIIDDLREKYKERLEGAYTSYILDLNGYEPSVSLREFLNKNKWIIAGGAVAGPFIALGGVAVLGFGSGGIAAGSMAAWMMSLYGGAVPAGGLVATLQSVGAAGLGASGVLTASAAGGAFGAFAGKIKGWWHKDSGN
ncbi:10634_t:CDS:1 [Ambispora gerdemannii]|uniref:10634_t:CDS:1 n=1 Tax=Ambispora gerdemannii TaxID=144530 RepID=A0A9N9A5E0_9GLOM|nr:10634_t:CDS:1 [Ambispora gerdemannii]